MIPRYMRAAKWKFEDGKKCIKGTTEWKMVIRFGRFELGLESVESLRRGSVLAWASNVVQAMDEHCSHFVPVNNPPSSPAPSLRT